MLPVAPMEMNDIIKDVNDASSSLFPLLIQLSCIEQRSYRRLLPMIDQIDEAPRPAGPMHGELFRPRRRSRFPLRGNHGVRRVEGVLVHGFGLPLRVLMDDGNLGGENGIDRFKRTRTRSDSRNPRSFAPEPPSSVLQRTRRQTKPNENNWSLPAKRYDCGDFWNRRRSSRYVDHT